MATLGRVGRLSGEWEIGMKWKEIKNRRGALLRPVVTTW